MSPQLRSTRRIAGTASFGALALAAALAFGASRAAAETSKLSACKDAAWKEYNSCLVSAGTEWAKDDCDTNFRLSYSECYVEYFKDVIGIFF